MFAPPAGAPEPISAHPPVRTGTRRVAHISLELGGELRDVDQHWVLVGTPNDARDNVILAIHALTGTAQVHEWWSSLVGPGRALDTSRYAILCANVLGGCAGSTGAREQDDTPFPALTTRDQARQLWDLLDAFDVHTPRLVAGGSLGGMLALEVAALRPDRVDQVVALAAPATQTALGAGWHALMRSAVQLGRAHGAPAEGLAVARMAGMLSYRSADGLEARFGAPGGNGGATGIADWLGHHGEKLVERFDAASYVSLLDAMDRHDVGRDRGGLLAALGPIATRITGVGIPGDLLYPHDAVLNWTTRIGSRYREVRSPHGHDAFLLEDGQVGAILREALQRSHRAVAAAAAAPVDTSAALVPDPLSASRIALAGCGSVGDAFVAALARHQHRTILTSVLVRDTARARPGLRSAVEAGLVPVNAVTRDASAALAGAPDVLVEVLGGLQPARALVEAALRRGVRVVTSNKALIAAHGPALLALARAHNTTLDFEGAVGAGIPVVRLLRRRSAGSDITRIAGVLNGTTNAVLEAVAEGASFADAVAQAQADGFAEADPSRDLDGRDAEDKLRILAWLAFGVAPQSLVVTRRGIDATVARWARGSARHGRRIRLMATVSREGNALVAQIAPVSVAADDAWGSLRGVQNRIEITSASRGVLALSGPGAGGAATARALLGDIAAPALDAIA